jgi:membrane protease YdiL (CAAX protease family)
MFLAAPLASAALQVALFTAIPLLSYTITRRGVKGFAGSIGLVRPPRRALLYGAAAGMAGALLMLPLLSMPGFKEVATAPHTVAGRLRSLGFTGRSVILLILYAVFQTSLSEEILFRGFLAKRLIRWLGFAAGCTLQSVLFGAIHGLLFVAPGAPAPSPARVAMVVVPPAVAGWLIGYINERIGRGSILPGWCSHALANVLAYGGVAFL